MPAYPSLALAFSAVKTFLSNNKIEELTNYLRSLVPSSANKATDRFVTLLGKLGKMFGDPKIGMFRTYLETITNHHRFP